MPPAGAATIMSGRRALLGETVVAAGGLLAIVRLVLFVVEQL
jgi:hypothetical protein